MPATLEKQPLRQVLRRLGEFLEEPITLPSSQARTDDVALGGFRFLLEWKGSSALPVVALATDSVLRRRQETDNEAIPLLAVPFMGPAGRRLCLERGVSWLDLSGNARIIGRGLRILVEGRPNQFKRQGRPSTAFAPKSSRVARHLLMSPGKAITQREISQTTGLSQAYVSQIVSRLLGDGLVVREPTGEVRALNPDLLLEAWLEHYDFSQHEVLRGHIPAHAGEPLLQPLARTLAEEGLDHAATGLAAAWLQTGFAGFRLVTLYLQEEPSPQLLDRLSFRAEARGANVWLVVPKDEGVFQGVAEYGGVRCVHPVQTYLDLKGQPERAAEAADKLKADLLRWRRS